MLAAEITPVAELRRRTRPAPDDAGLALRFPRFTGRWRDDKTTEDATTSDELLAMYRTARSPRTGPAGSLA